MADFAILERTRFFAGRILTAEDVEREQRYQIERARRHHRFLHGWGVVCGLDVRIESEVDVRVGPGLAIDCAGNELVLPSAIRLPITGGAATLYVAIRYLELETQPVPVPGNGTTPSLVREAADLLLLEAHPAARHRGMGPGTPGCGQPHAVALAALRRDARGGWTVRRLKRGA